MANQITKKEFDEIKNLSLSVVSFDTKGVRTLTYAGLSYKKAVEHVFREQKNGRICLIVPVANFGAVSEDLVKNSGCLPDYLTYLKGGK